MRRVLLSLAAVVLLVAAQAVYDAKAGGPALAAPSVVFDAGQKGPFEIGFTSFVLTDPARSGDNGVKFEHRPIPVYVWYPVDPPTVTGSAPEALYPLDPLYDGAPDSPASDWVPYGLDRAYQEPAASTRGPFPLVVFSPGWGVPAWMHMSVGARLASHGFVVAVVYHFGDQWWPWEPPYDNIAVASFNRPRDLSFVLTDLLAKNGTPGHLLAGTIRPDQVAAAGWSLGGYAAITLASGDDSVCDTLYGWDVTDPPAWTCAPSLPDPRFRAIVPLDGSGWILHFPELARVEVPALGMGEEWSRLAALVAEGLIPPGFEAWGARQHAAYSGHPNYRADVFNSDHQSFSDFCDGLHVLVDKGLLPPDVAQPQLDDMCTPFIPSLVVHRLVTEYMIAFLKTNLAGEPGYQSMLTPGWALTREPAVEFFVTEKRNPHSIDADWPNDFIYFMHQPGSAQAKAAKEPAQRPAVPRMTLPR